MTQAERVRLIYILLAVLEANDKTTSFEERIDVLNIAISWLKCEISRRKEREERRRRRAA